MDLRWVYITNPYALDPEEETADAAVPGYQQMATNTLEALSTAATRDSDTQLASSYTAASYADNNAMFAQYNTSHTAYPSYAARPITANTLSSSLIDPNLEAVASIEHQNNVNLPMSSPDQVAALLQKY
jgi:hypothetical protein